MQTAWCGKLFYICSIFTGQFYLLISAMLILNLLNEILDGFLVFLDENGLLQ